MTPESTSALRRRIASRQAGQGMVTAEAAIVLPIFALFALAMVWLVSVAITQVRVVDAARDAARAVARGDDDGAVVSAARRTAGADATVVIHQAAGLVSVTVSERTAAPRWLLVPLPSVTVTSESTVAAEDDLETP